MANVDAKIQLICDKLDSLSTEIKSNNDTLDRFITRTELALKNNELQLNDIKTDFLSFSNKLAAVEQSQKLISTQYDTQAKRHDTIVIDHTKMQKNITGFTNEIEKFKKDLKNEKMERSREAQ